MEKLDLHRNASDKGAFRYLGKFEMRRLTKNTFGIFLRGTTVQAGTVSMKAAQLVRALSSIMDGASKPHFKKHIID